VQRASSELVVPALHVARFSVIILRIRRSRYKRTVDYVAWASAIAGVNALHSGYSIETLLHALNQARLHPGLSLIHVPVYYGPDELGGMGVFGRWNVGNWSADTQALRHQIGL
jgi:3D-(3,5/4)-trihydroxycyclohexane-1,2-dione acylhydrolase (decyclizing)